MWHLAIRFRWPALAATFVVILLFLSAERLEIIQVPTRLRFPNGFGFDRNSTEASTADQDGRQATSSPSSSSIATQSPTGITPKNNTASTNSSHPERNKIVIAHLHDEDVSWVEVELPNWGRALYIVDQPNASTLHTPINKGRESMAYLTYLVDFYDRLPPISIFLHPAKAGYPEAWHNDAPDYSNVFSVQHLQLDYVQESGYVNLRCNTDPGCGHITNMQPHRQPSDPEKTTEQAMVEAWPALFGEPAPDEVAQPCCSQFAVSRDAIRARPRAEYERYRQWLVDTELPDGISGRVFEYAWQFMFGKGPVFCPVMRECYCKVYGRMCF